MASMNAAAVAAVELEKVASKVPTLFERESTFYSQLEKRPVEVISGRDMRIPLELLPGGNFGHWNPDNGALGTGDAPFFDKAVINSAHLRMAVTWTKKAEWETDNSRKAVLSAFKHLTATAMKEFRRYCDTACMQAGDGIIANPTAVSVAGGVVVSGADRWTLSATDGIGGRLTRHNQTVAVYDSALSASRGEAKIVFHDPVNRIIETSPSIGAAVLTDKILFSGLTGATPVSVLGVPYHNNSASTGLWLGLNRATYPAIRANEVVASGGFTLPYARLAINKITDRIGNEGLGKLTAWMHPCQKQAYEELGQLISIIQKGPKEEALDLYFGDNMQMAGAPVKTSNSWNKTRIDFIDLSTWGRAELHPAGFYDVEGRRLFESRDGDGGLLASQTFYLVVSHNMYNSTPTAGAYISGLSIPSGY